MENVRPNLLIGAQMPYSLQVKQFLDSSVTLRSGKSYSFNLGFRGAEIQHKNQGCVFHVSTVALRHQEIIKKLHLTQKMHVLKCN